MATRQIGLRMNSSNECIISGPVRAIGHGGVLPPGSTLVVGPESAIGVIKGALAGTYSYYDLIRGMLYPQAYALGSQLYSAGCALVRAGEIYDFGDVQDNIVLVVAQSYGPSFTADAIMVRNPTVARPPYQDTNYLVVPNIATVITVFDDAPMISNVGYTPAYAEFIGDSQPADDGSTTTPSIAFPIGSKRMTLAFLDGTAAAGSYAVQWQYLTRTVSLGSDVPTMMASRPLADQLTSTAGARGAISATHNAEVYDIPPGVNCMKLFNLGGASTHQVRFFVE